MNPNIINPHKYKRITKTTKFKKDKKSLKNIKKNKPKNYSYDYLKVIKRKEVKKKKLKVRKIKSLKIFIYLFIILITIISIIAIMNIDTKAVIEIFKPKEKEIVLVEDYSFKIGISNLDTSKNVVLNELYKYSNNRILSYDENYNIKLELATNITKKDDLNYEIEFKDESSVNIVTNEINSLKNNTNNKYYSLLSNILYLTPNKNKLTITLKYKNAYILYALDFRLENSLSNEYNFNSSDLTFNRVDDFNKSKLKSISVKNYEDKDNLIADFRNNNLDMFLTSSQEDIRLIGQHQYNIEKYRDGETYFLFGNKKSLLFSQKEVREAIAYSLNRNEIVKHINPVFTEVIDIPYIYSNVNYKYDIFRVENSLIASSWEKNSGIYRKNIAGSLVNLEMSLLVNKDDNAKVTIANDIKNMLESIGIKINIEKLNSNDINTRIKNNNYDIVLASIYLNNIPDITHLYEYININDNLNNAIENVNNSDLNNISQNINILMNTISSEEACIGIAAKNTNVVFQSYINGIEDISYFNIFKDIDKIGKIL